MITKEDLKAVQQCKPILTKFVSLMFGSEEKTYACEYGFLNDKRVDLFKAQYEDSHKYIQQGQKEHEAVMSFLVSLQERKIDQVRKFLLEQNKGPDGTSFSRTICLMDATFSMSHLLHNAKTTVGTMFKRAYEVLKDNNIGSDSFELQFAVYRNYNCDETKILQNSPWETKSDNLRAFLNKIEAEGDQGNEAIEIGLLHANNENEDHSISQVILIGDAPANTKDEVQSKRGYLKEEYWQKIKFKQMTFYKTELEKLKQKKIPVHAFYVAKRAEKNFREIAAVSGGRCELLDINSPNGAAMLTDLVTEEILRNVGKGKNGNGGVLVDAYRLKFGKSYA